MRAQRYSKANMRKNGVPLTLYSGENDRKIECKLEDEPSTRAFYDLTVREVSIDIYFFPMLDKDFNIIRGGMIGEMYYKNETYEVLLQSARPEYSSGGLTGNIVSINTYIDIGVFVPHFDEIGTPIGNPEFLPRYTNIPCFYTDQNKDSRQVEGGIDQYTVVKLQFPQKYNVAIKDKIIAKNRNGYIKYLEVVSIGGFGLEGVWEIQCKIFNSKEDFENENA